MKNLKFPLIAVFITALFTIAFIGCKKDSLTPSVTSDAKGGVALLAHQLQLLTQTSVLIQIQAL